ncbi:MAG: hypothetical protein Kow0090_15750 [Myxococcota bacterium]
MRVEICVTYIGGGPPEPRIFDSDIITIGRNPSSDLVLAEGAVSSLHGRIILKNNRFFYQDLHSTNGTLIKRSGESWRVAPSSAEGEEIFPGDVLLLGDAVSPVELFIASLEYPTKKKGEKTPATIIARISMGKESEVTNDARCLNALYSILKTTSAEEERGKALGNIADCIAGSVKKVKRVQFAFRFNDEWQTVLRRSFDLHSEDESRGVPKAIADVVWQKKEAVLFTDMDVNPISKSVAASKSPLFACAPVATKESGDGVLLVESSDSSAISTVDLELIAAAASHAALVVDRIAAMEELKRARQKLKNENIFLKEQQKREKEYEIIGESEAVKNLINQINRLAATEATVLITGETGTGKELVARSLHYKNQKRREALFIAVNCGAIPENLLESELFGHKKGSFTGAIADRQGMFALADGGTLFLDEIGEIPLNLQVKLLRALQEGEFWPIGAQKPVRSDVRLISATNKVLQEEMAKGAFREDLYYRIRVVELHIPPLRERKEDIPMLAAHFLKKLSEKRADVAREFSPSALSVLSAYDFPGNVRELMNEVERAAIFAAPGEIIGVEHLSPHISQGEGTEEEAGNGSGGGYLKETLLKYEKGLIESALREHNGNRTATADFLGISRQALLMKMKKLDIK